MLRPFLRLALLRSSRCQDAQVGLVTVVVAALRALVEPDGFGGSTGLGGTGTTGVGGNNPQAAVARARTLASAGRSRRAWRARRAPATRRARPARRAPATRRARPARPARGTTGAGGTTVIAPPPSSLPNEQACGSNVPGPRLIRRLTAIEFASSVRSIFNDQSIPVATVFSDPTILGFQVDANALLVQELNASQLMDNAEAVAAWAATTMSRLTAFGNCSTKDAACGQKFVKAFGLKAFRARWPIRTRASRLT